MPALVIDSPTITRPPRRQPGKVVTAATRTACVLHAVTALSTAAVVSTPQPAPITPTAPGPAPVTAPVGAVGHAADLIDLLLTVAYIDGVFHHRELTFVHNYIDTVLMMAEDMSGGSVEERIKVRVAYQAQFRTLHAQLDLDIARLAQEVESTDDGNYLVPRLTIRAMAIFKRLPADQQAVALELVRAMMHADGTITQAESRLYDELVRFLTATPPAPPPAPPPQAAAPTPTPATGAGRAATGRRAMPLLPPHWNPLKRMAHPLLAPLEQTYSPHPIELQSQLGADYQLIANAMAAWERLRAVGQGRLAGVKDIEQVPVGAQFLDGHVHVLRPSKPVELVVLGDLHGCYSCLKAALLQSDFINRVWAHQWDPQTYPDIKLVLLGDYIDRGCFSFDGVLRAVLQLFVSMPDHVVVLRGNHEYFKSREGRVFSGVHPAEGLYSIVRHAPLPLLEAYKSLFDQLPTSLLFERTLFVHGGIPRDDTFAAHYQDLSSLDHAELRFQMLWSDPVQADHIPVELQRKSSRFSFGRRQFTSFMEKLGCYTMIRGHEQIEAGFEVIYDHGDRSLLNLFSAGGHDNRDLPADSSYRKVRPMALTVVHDAAGLRGIPWPLEYQPFNYEVHNGLYRPAPLLEYRNT